MEIKKFNRKPFAVNAVEVTLENVHEVAAWCGGTVEMQSTRMMGTQAKLPVIKMSGPSNAKDTVATLGCFIAELKGNFRVYKNALFFQVFDKVPVNAEEYDPESTINTPENDHEATLQGIEAENNGTPDPETIYSVS
jgi:hypothetical protein